MGVFARSWEITKLSFDVIKKDRELLLFPLLGGLFSLLFIVALLVPTLITSFIKGQQTYGTEEYLIIFAIYFGLVFIATFFNVCVVYTTKIRFAGGNATFNESIKFALSKIHLILSWSLLSATVGLILRMIDNLAEKAGKGGEIILRIINMILGMLWSIITIFVVPSMVYHDLGPIDAIKKSVEVLRKTWGESLIRYYGLGLIQFLFLLLGVVIGVPLFLILSSIGVFGIIAALSILTVYFIGTILVFSVANGVFNTALYVYADTGKVPKGYNKEIMTNAFQTKKSRTQGLI